MISPDETYILAVFLVALFVYLLRTRSDNLVLLYAGACWLANSWAAYLVASSFLVFGLIVDALVSFAYTPQDRA